MTLQIFGIWSFSWLHGTIYWQSFAMNHFIGASDIGFGTIYQGSYDAQVRKCFLKTNYGCWKYSLSSQLMHEISIYTRKMREKYNKIRASESYNFLFFILYKIEILLNFNLSVCVWNSLLKTWISVLTPHTLQILILVEWHRAKGVRWSCGILVYFRVSCEAIEALILVLL